MLLYERQCELKTHYRKHQYYCIEHVYTASSVLLQLLKKVKQLKEISVGKLCSINERL